MQNINQDKLEMCGDISSCVLEVLAPLYRMDSSKTGLPYHAGLTDAILCSLKYSLSINAINVIHVPS